MTAAGAAIGITTAVAEPFLDTLMPEDVVAWQSDWKVLSAEVLAADDAQVRWVQFGVDKHVHGDVECGDLVKPGWN